MKLDRSDPRPWKTLYVGCSVVFALASFAWALALCFAAPWTLRFLGVDSVPITWTQLCGELLGLVSIFYVPAILNLDRFRPHAWIGAAVAPGAVFLLCVVGVIATQAPKLFLIWGLLALLAGGVQLFLLVRLEHAEHRGSAWNGGPRARWQPEPCAPRNEAQAACYRRIYAWVSWIGIGANLLFVLPLVFTPHWMLRFLGVGAEPVIWAQMAGLLLGLISVFYIPAILNPDKYRPFAWLAIFPSRSAGVLFCFVAVVALEANDAFMLGVFLDLPFAVLQAFILCRLASLEKAGDPRYCLGRRYWPVAAALLAAVAILGTLGWHKLQREYPQQLVDDSIEEAFKYGSIGTENANGLPYWLWAALPSVFPEYLPRPGGYSGLGFLWEPGRELPVGFSRKKIGFDRVGLNCALCHAGSAQLPGEPRPRIYLGAEAVTADILGYQRFLFACANDPRFNATTLMPAIGRLTRLSWIDSLTYRLALIPATRQALQAQAKLWTWTYEKDRPEWGPGRIEPFNPVKVSILNVKVGATLGTCDMQPLWRLGAIPGRALHWDGMNTDLREVVDSSALGDGATPQSIPRPFLRKIEAWIQTNAPPAFPFTNQVNPGLLARGGDLYRAECARCHAPGGELTGKVIPVSGADGVGTDDNRAKMWTPESAAAYNAYLGHRDWRFTHFRATGGYLNVPLDGLWLRAPYLHNGSVPTLADLLEPVAKRPTVFWRGLVAYDPVKVGFVSTGPQAEAEGFRFDTAGRGNSNQGHLYGTNLSPEDKAALLEYLKTL